MALDHRQLKAKQQADVYVPDAFTPNGDGKNDRFGPVTVGIKDLIYFQVYNRWEQRVFHTNDLKGWDGRWIGRPQEQGVYIWLINALDYVGNRIE